MKKALTIDDLIKFCEERNFYKFDANESGYQIRVKAPATFEKEKNVINDSFLYCKVKVLHTNKNRNGSSVTYNAAKDSMKTLAYKPILAAFATFTDIDENGEEIEVEDFTYHDIEYDDNGEPIYNEHQVGSFTVDKPTLDYDEETDRYYLNAYCVIPREYTHAAQIIERKNGTRVSSEIAVNKMSYDAKEKVLMLEDIEVMGLTLLGRNPEKDGEEVKEGMEGSRADIEAFALGIGSEHIVQDKDNNKLFEIVKEMKETLDNYILANAKQNSEEGGRNMKFEELLEKYSKTLEDIDFDYEEMSEEELETKFEELFGESEEPTSEEIEEPTNEEFEESEESEDVDENFEEVIEGDSEVSEEFEEEQEETTDDSTISYSVIINGERKEFSLSINEKLTAISTLVNDTYCESDNAYYSCEVFDDDKYVVMIDYWNGNAYKQSYKVRNDVYTLVGDRIPVYATWCTEDERKALNDMKSKFSLYEEEIERYHHAEENEKKMNLFASGEFRSIKDTIEFRELSKEENYDKLSFEEVESKLDGILTKYTKLENLKFSNEEAIDPVSEKKSVRLFSQKKEKNGRYGSLKFN